jgi:hypothetical protein
MSWNSNSRVKVYSGEIMGNYSQNNDLCQASLVQIACNHPGELIAGGQVKGDLYQIDFIIIFYTA